MGAPWHPVWGQAGALPELWPRPRLSVPVLLLLVLQSFPSFQSLHSLLSSVYLSLLRRAWGLGTGTRQAAVGWIDPTEIYYQVIKPIYSHGH